MANQRRNFQRAAESLLVRLALPSGAVTLRETRRNNQAEIIADIESGALPKETPDHIGDYSVVYQTRRVLKAR